MLPGVAIEDTATQLCTKGDPEGYKPGLEGERSGVGHRQLATVDQAHTISAGQLSLHDGLCRLRRQELRYLSLDRS